MGLFSPCLDHQFTQQPQWDSGFILLQLDIASQEVSEGSEEACGSKLSLLEVPIATSLIPGSVFPWRRAQAHLSLSSQGHAMPADLSWEWYAVISAQSINPWYKMDTSRKGNLSWPALPVQMGFFPSWWNSDHIRGRGDVGPSSSPHPLIRSDLIPKPILNNPGDGASTPFFERPHVSLGWDFIFYIQPAWFNPLNPTSRLFEP